VWSERERKDFCNSDGILVFNYLSIDNFSRIYVWLITNYSMLKGSDENPGLAMLAIAEILSMAEQNGKLVTVSLYGVYQEYVYDLLDPKQPTVSILEDKGKI
jgi:hypothetical protein